MDKKEKQVFFTVSFTTFCFIWALGALVALIPKISKYWWGMPAFLTSVLLAIALLLVFSAWLSTKIWK